MVVVGGDCVSEDEVDDDVGGDVDGDPGYSVLAWELGGDFAEIFGARYDLQVGIGLSADIVTTTFCTNTSDGVAVSMHRR